MKPVRAFFLAFAAGLAVLFSGHGAIAVAFPEQPVETGADLSGLPIA